MIEKECRITDLSVIFCYKDDEPKYTDIEMGLDYTTKIRISKELYDKLGTPQLWETLVFTLSKGREKC